MKGRMTATVAVILLAASAGVAQVNIETVTVGNPGNPDDPNTLGMFPTTMAWGGVAEEYNIGKYEVTAGQYCQFLSAVAQTDTYELWDQRMLTYDGGCNIQRTGSPGSYTYSVASDWANRPVNVVTYWDACRFVNWMHNGQPDGAQDATTTENGAYTLNGYMGGDGREIVRNPGAKFFIPTLSEWYKAAYHMNDGPTDNYWDYPTGTDATPSNDLFEPDPGNNANFKDTEGYGIGWPYWIAEVGEYENSDSPYGTFDQGGNLWEWTETITLFQATAVNRAIYGGSWQRECLFVSGNSYEGWWGYHDGSDLGFRVCTPEPATLALLALGGLAVIRRRRTR